MRILTALTYYRPHYSGLTIYAERVARGLVERGHQVTVLTSRFDPSLPKREVHNGVEVIRPRVLARVSKGVLMPTLPLLAWREARRADVIHLHTPQLDAAYIAALGRMLGKPVVLSYHCDLQLPHGTIHAIANRVSDAANHIAAGLANVVVHNTRDYAEHSRFLRGYLGKLQAIYPPVRLAEVSEADLQAFREKFRLLPGQRIIGMAARLATEKGVEYLAEALPAILQRYPTARVLFVGPNQSVVGEEAYGARLAPLLARLSEHWTFLGILTPVEMAAFFHLCEVTVLPSINSTESYGMVQVESMTCGTPVVASDLPGVRVPVQATGMGCSVPPRDSAGLARAILKVLDDPAAFRGHSDELIRLSTPEAVAGEFERLFERLLKK